MNDISIHNTLRISTKVMQALKDISDWYIGRYYTYIRIYGSTSAPHLLPRYVLNKVIIRKIAYQTIDDGVTTLLASNSKRYWPTFLITVGTQTLKNMPRAKEEKALKYLILCIGKARQHDPKGTTQIHLKSIGLVSTNQNQIDTEEDPLSGTLSFE
jgi:hypothetical protein